MNGDNLQPLQQYDLTLLPQLPDAGSTDDLEIVDGARVRSARTILAASDSSVDPIDGRATFNWRITTTRKVGLISKCDVVRSNPKYMNSYRGEFAGLNSLITWLLDNSFHTKTIKIVCDNRSCVDILQDLHIQLTDLDKAEADLIIDTRRKLSRFAQVTVEWVKGHQDDSIPYEDLPLEAQLNVDCDQGAKKHMTTITASTNRPEPLPGSKATLYIGPHMVTTELKNKSNMPLKPLKCSNILRISLDGLMHRSPQ
jgi:ribonuclease HI